MNKKAFFKNIFTCLFLFTICATNNGQNVDLGNIIKKNQYDPVYNPISAPVSGTSRDFLPVSPTAGSLGVFGQIPVGNYTGTANINVPLYTIKYKELSLPISLNYHASGIKPELFPGPVGLGWALIAGGSISRVIKGYPDWGDYPAESSALPQPLISQRAATDWDNVDKLKLYLKQSTLAFANTNEPDEYYFNINGESGKFYADHTDTFRIQSSQGRSFQITMHYEGMKTYSFAKLPQYPQLWYFEATGPRPVDPEDLYPYSHTIELRKVISGFTIIDESGIKYTFGGSEKSIEFSRPGLHSFPEFPENYITPTTWYLTAIESPMGYKIEFEYQQQTIISKSFFSDMVLYQFSGSSNITTSLNAMSADCVKSTLINGCYLTQINFPNGKIVVDNSYASYQLAYDSYLSYEEIPKSDFLDFRHYPDVGLADTEKVLMGNNEFVPHKVDALRVYDKNNNEIRKISFRYPPNMESRNRLKLFQVDIEAPSAEKQTYSFRYNDLSFPSYRYAAFQTDAYGYWNAKYQFADVEAKDFTKYMCEHPDYLTQLKQPDPNYIQSEILNKIVYPTGGYTLFDYETHEYNCSYLNAYDGIKQNENGNKTASGVRIKSVRNYDKDKTLLSEKRYHYVKDYITGGTTSSGVLAYTPQFYELYENKRLVEIDRILKYFFRYSTNPTYPLSETRGNLVTYSEVAVEDVGNGVSVYKYKNYDNGYGDHQLRGFVGNQLSDASGGNLITFKKNTEGSSMALERGQLLNQKVYDKNKILKKEIRNTYNDDPKRFNEHVRYLAYTPLSINMTGFSFHTISAGVYYTYFPYLKEQTELDYLGSGTVTKTTRYEYDSKYRLLKSLQIIDNGKTVRKKTYYYPHETMNVAINNQMVAKRLLSLPVKEEFQAEGSRITTYHQYATGLAKNHSDWILKKSASSQLDNGPIYVDVSYQAYDALGNPNGINYRKEGDNTYLWSYNGEYPVAFIEGVNFNKVKEILGDSFIEQLMNKSMPTENDIQSIRTRLAVTKAPITTYTYQPLIGVTSVTQPNGMKLTYSYDAFGHLLTVKDGDGKLMEEYDYHYYGN